MNRQAKSATIEYLVEQLKSHECFYVIDSSHLSVAAIEQFRRYCYEEQAIYKVVKNTLALKALAECSTMPNEYDSLKDDVFKKMTGVIFIKENAQRPAKLILKFRQQNGFNRPVLKGAYVNGELFLGDDKLEMLNKLKSKQELIAGIIYTLQTPIKNILSALQNGGSQLVGILKTLGDRDK